MSSNVICVQVNENEYISGPIIKPCDLCKKDCWVCIKSLIWQADKKDAQIICTKCYLKKSVYKPGASHVENIRRLLENISKEYVE